MAQRQSSNQSNLRRPGARPGILDITLEEISDQAAGERLRSAYELILFAEERSTKEAYTGSDDAQEELQKG
jgi:hypothetical protein